MEITRLSKTLYRVGRVNIRREIVTTEPEITYRWAARPDNDPEGRPLFVTFTLEEALDMAAGAIEMLRPV